MTQTIREFALIRRFVRHVGLAWQSFTLGGILLGTLSLRLAGINFGLPLVFNGDEVYVIEHSVALDLHDLNPHAFFYGSLPFYILKLVTVIGAYIIHFNQSSLGVQDYYLLGRFVSITFGTATVYLAFVLGRMLVNPNIGLLSAAIFAVSPLAVNISHYATVDSMMGFWSALALVAMVAVIKGDNRGWYVAGAVTGLAISTKFNAVVLLVPIILIAMGKENAAANAPSRAIMLIMVSGTLVAAMTFVGFVIGRDYILNLVASWTSRGQLQPVYLQIFDRILSVYFLVLLLSVGTILGSFRNWSLANRVISVLTSPSVLKPILSAAAVFALTSPFVFLDLPDFVREFFFQVNKLTSGGITGYATGSRSYLAVLSEESSTFNPLQYVTAIEREWGFLVFAAIFVGLWALWKQDRRVFLPFGGLVFLMLVGSVTWRYQATRYLFPMWTLLALFSALGIVYASRMFFSSIKNPWINRAAIGALLIIALQAPLRESIDDVSYGFLTPDTRNLALSWVEENVLPGKFILREWGTPEIERASSAYRVHYTGFPFEEATLAEWKARGVNFVMISAERYDFYRGHAADFKDVLAEYDRLKNENSLLQTFEAGPGVKGPPVYIYSLN